MNARQFQFQIIRHSDKSYRMALSILKDESGAKDALQDIMMRLWEKREQLDAIANYQAFVLTSMRNLCLDMIRKPRHTIDIPADIEYTGPNPYQQTEKKRHDESYQQNDRWTTRNAKDHLADERCGRNGIEGDCRINVDDRKCRHRKPLKGTKKTS